MNNLHLKKLQEIRQKLLEVRFKDSKDNLIKTIKDKEIVDEILETIETLPQSKRGVYLQWLHNMYKKDKWTVLHYIKPILSDIKMYNDAIEKNIPGIEKDFLKQVKTFDEFTIFMKNIEDILHNHKRNKTKEKDITLLFENEEWFILIPHTEEAAIKYGKGTKWCTSALNNNAFDNYNEDGYLIYFVNKKTTNKNVAVYFDTNEMEIDSFWNAFDKKITLKTFGILIEQIYDKSMENFYKFLEKSKDKKVIFGLNCKKAYNFISQNKEVPKEILMLKNSDGNSVAHHLAQNNLSWSTNDKEILMLRNNVDNTVAHYLATYNPNWSTNDREILMLKNQQGNTVAHYLMNNNPNWSTDDKEILMLRDNVNNTVAHYLMNNNPNWSTDDKEILMLRDNVNNTVAHYLAMYNMKWLTNDKEILMLRDNIDKTVAHYLAMHNPNWSTDDKEILKSYYPVNLNSVAHYLARHSPNWSTDDKEILMLKNQCGDSVAHYLAINNQNWSTDDKEILMLKNQQGNTVAYFLN